MLISCVLSDVGVVDAQQVKLKLNFNNSLLYPSIVLLANAHNLNSNMLIFDSKSPVPLSYVGAAATVVVVVAVHLTAA